MVDGSQRLARTRLVVAVLLGTLGRCRVYQTWPVTSLRVASLGAGPVPLCLDGEATEMKPALRIVRRPRSCSSTGRRSATDRRRPTDDKN
jgi:hypothetical protein